jgi:hypothetical protein
MIHKRQNMYQCYKKQILLIYIVRLLDTNSKIPANARKINRNFGKACWLQFRNKDFSPVRLE